MGLEMLSVGTETLLVSRFCRSLQVVSPAALESLLVSCAPRVFLCLFFYFSLCWSFLAPQGLGSQLSLSPCLSIPLSPGVSLFWVPPTVQHLLGTPPPSLCSALSSARLP